MNNTLQVDVIYNIVIARVATDIILIAVMEKDNYLKVCCKFTNPIKAGQNIFKHSTLEIMLRRKGLNCPCCCNV